MKEAPFLKSNKSVMKSAMLSPQGSPKNLLQHSRNISSTVSKAKSSQLELHGEQLKTTAPKKKKKRMKKTKLKKAKANDNDIPYEGPDLIEEFNKGLMFKTQDVRSLP